MTLIINTTSLVRHNKKLFLAISLLLLFSLPATAIEDSLQRSIEIAGKIK